MSQISKKLTQLHQMATKAQAEEDVIFRFNDELSKIAKLG